MRFQGPILLLLVSACTGVYSDPPRTTEPTEPTDPAGQVEVPQIVTGRKQMFVTSTNYQGGLLGGLAGADAKCAVRAAAGGLTGTFKAWLSDSHRSAGARLTHSTGSYSLVDGTLVVASWDDLVATRLQHAIDHDEFGHLHTGPIGCIFQWPMAWTETTVKGDKHPEYPGVSDDLGPCGDWAEISHDGFYSDAFVGNVLASDSFWTEGTCAAACTDHAALYCFEQ